MFCAILGVLSGLILSSLQLRGIYMCFHFPACVGDSENIVCPKYACVKPRGFGNWFHSFPTKLALAGLPPGKLKTLPMPGRRQRGRKIRTAERRKGRGKLAPATGRGAQDGERERERESERERERERKRQRGALGLPTSHPQSKAKQRESERDKS